MSKAMVFDIKRFAVHDGDGIRTTVFLKGCPLKCLWCHNPEGISPKPQLAYYSHKCIGCGECINVCPQKAHKIENGMHIFARELCTNCGKCERVCLGNALKLYGKKYTVQEILPILLEDREFYDNSGGGVTISGGECLLHADFCKELLMELKKENIHTAVDTCGFVPKEAFDKVMPYTDIFLYDIKAIDENIHIKCTGQSNKIILENLKYIDDSGKNIEVRIPYVPGYNSDEKDKIINIIKQFNNITKVRVLAYHNYAGSKYDALSMENTLPSTIPSDEAVEQFQKEIDQTLM
ncbi:MAG: glycyl-radical enzyme activating protein [Clostridiales bacterium]|nr:glycyl-radical enzyme activating protein [Clostridiales bacterium]